MTDEITSENIVGKTVLIGLTHEDKNGEIIEQEQFWGTITKVDESRGIIISKPTGEEFSLPPALHAFSVAPPGEYKLRSTGEIVVNPDLLSTWTVTKPEEE